MNRTILAGAAGVLAFIAAAQGLAQSPASTSPKALKPGAYKVEPYHTQVRFSVSHFGFTDFSGFFSGASGSLDFDPARLAATKLNVSVPVGSVLTTVPQLNEELKGSQWFDAARDPAATFVSGKVSQTGPQSADVSGQLTLHGVTRPLTLHVRFVGAGINPLDKTNTIGFAATGVIKRSEFGIKTYVPLVGDDVQLSIAGAFIHS